MQLVKSIKIVFVCGRQILHGNPSDLKKGEKVLLAKPQGTHLFPPELELYEIVSMAARMEHTVYIEVRVKKIK